MTYYLQLSPKRTHLYLLEDDQVLYRVVLKDLGDRSIEKAMQEIERNTGILIATKSWELNKGH